MKRILVVGRHEEVLGRVVTTLARAGYEPVGHLHDVDVLRSLGEGPFDALLVGGGVEPTSRPNLVDAYLRANPGGRVIEHFGGLVGLLETVERALGLRAAQQG